MAWIIFTSISIYRHNQPQENNMSEKIMTDYINKIDSMGNYCTTYGEVSQDQLEVLPEYGFPVLKSLNLRSIESRLNDLHNYAVLLDDDKLLFMIADVSDKVKKLQAQVSKYKTKIEHIKHDLEGK